METTIQWYPGHMVKAKKMVRENLKLVDMVIEIVDARIPISSRNPDLDEIIGDKPRIVVMNKSDLADSEFTKSWRKWFEKQGLKAVAVNSTTGQGIDQIITLAREIGQGVMQKLQAKGRRPRAVRMMIIGIPNVGKSSLINRLAGKGTTRTGDRPGVTRGKQWIRVSKDMELLDTPGILWPKFEDPEIGFKLAVTGAIKEEILNVEHISSKLLPFLIDNYPERLQNRYKLETLSNEVLEVLKNIGKRRGLLVAGGQVDVDKTSHVLLSEFRTGKLGQFTLDFPEQESERK